MRAIKTRLKPINLEQLKQDKLLARQNARLVEDNIN